MPSLPAGVDAVTLARYANAVLGAVQALLEDEATPPMVLPPLLGALQQAARHQHSLKCAIHRPEQQVECRLQQCSPSPSLPCFAAA